MLIVYGVDMRYTKTKGKLWLCTDGPMKNERLFITAQYSLDIKATIELNYKGQVGHYKFGHKGLIWVNSAQI